MRRLPVKRTVLIFAALLLLAGITVLVWEVSDWPPPRLILKYGFPPTGGPTGRTKVIEGFEFFELKPGYVYISTGGRRRSLLDRLARLMGLDWSSASTLPDGESPGWMEVPGPFWIARTTIEGPRNGVERVLGEIAGASSVAVRRENGAEWRYAQQWPESANQGNVRVRECLGRAHYRQSSPIFTLPEDK